MGQRSNLRTAEAYSIGYAENMKLLSMNNSGVLLLLEPSEQLCFNNVLNEVCHAFQVRDFPGTIGISREAAELLLGKLYKLYSEHVSVQLELSRTEVSTIRNALATTLNELGDWEFPIRVGVPFAQAQTILGLVNQFAAGDVGSERS